MTHVDAFEVSHADPWAEGTPDLAALNAQVSDVLEDRIKYLRATARAAPDRLRPFSAVVLGPAGSGKTHLFTRLRKNLGPRAVFVHLRPLVGAEMTPRFVLGQIVHQLGYANRGLRQLDALVGSMLAWHHGGNPEFPRFFLDDCAQMSEEERSRTLEDALEAALGSFKEADEVYLRKLLYAPFANGATFRALSTWLSGNEPDEVQLARLGVSSGLPEESVLPALRTLGVMAAMGAPLVLVFDQLENLIDPESIGARVRSYANLVAELFDTVRGVGLVHMALDSEWQKGIFPLLSQAQKSRVAAQVLALQLPSPKQIEDLLRTWVDAIEDKPAPFPWPVGESQMAKWTRETGLTPRMLLHRCRQILLAGTVDVAQEVAEVSSEDAIAAAWDKHLERARAAVDEAAEAGRGALYQRLLDALAAGLAFVDAKLVVADAGQGTFAVRARQAELGGVLLFQTHPRSVNAALGRAAQAASARPLAILRERALDFPPTWKQTLARRAELERIPGVRWIMLERDEVTQLLALESLLAAARSRDIDDEAGRVIEERDVRDWVARTRGVAQWTAVRSLLGDSPPEIESVPEERARPPSDVTLAVLSRLRLASLDRLVREVARIDATATRGSVMSELEAASDRVKWFGRSIAALTEGT